MPPGQMALTRMRCGASSTATARVRLITAALAAEYACGPSPPLSPAIDAVLMKQPPCPCAFITRAPCFMPRNTPRTSTAKVQSHSSASMCVIGPKAPATPALLNTQSRRPKASRAAAMAARDLALPGHVGAHEAHAARAWPACARQRDGLARRWPR